MFVLCVCAVCIFSVCVGGSACVCACACACGALLEDEGERWLNGEGGK